MAEQIVEDVIFLEEIIANEDFILSDYWNPKNSWYEDGVYEAATFAKLNKDILMNHANKRLPEYLNWISNSKVHVIQRTIDQIGRFMHIISDKLSQLNKYEKGAKKSRTKSRRIKLDNNQSREIGKSLLEKISLMYHHLLKVSKQSLYKPRDQDLFQKVRNLVDVIADSTDSVRDYDHKYNRFTRKAENLHAAEQIVSSAIYRSLIGKKTAIVSQDSDISRLVSSTIMLTSNRDMLNNAYFMSKFIENPIHVYFVTPNGPLPGFVGEEIEDELKEHPFFEIKGSTKPQLARAKQKVEDYSKQILDITQGYKTA